MPDTIAATTPAPRPRLIGRQPLRAALRFVCREPLIHFFLLAGLIFGADAILHPPDRSAKTITVTQAMRETMARNFDEDRERVPTAREMKAMVENWVASEILYREGKRLGVDRGDDSIRDRLAYKMQLLIFSQLEQPVATEAKLRAWFDSHRDRFDEPERVSFYLSPPTDKAAARQQLAAVQAGADTETLQHSTRAVVGRPVSSLAASFGDAFRDGLLALPIEQWSVLRSAEGWHVVRLDSRRPGVSARFEDERDEVRREWMTDSMRLRAWEAVKRLRADYSVVYE